MVDMVKLVYAITMVLAIMGIMTIGQTAHATNESSYKIGFNGAITLYHCIAHPPPAPEDCGMEYSTYL
jgi:hypothetical protein